MKKFLKLGAAPAIVLALLSASMAQAATTPSLGAAASYGILSSTYTNTTAGTTINGDVGFTTGPAVAPAGTHANYGSGAPYAQAGSDQGTALTALGSQPCTFTFGAGAIDLSTDITHGAAGVFIPGVYCSSGAMNISGPLTLSGPGTFIFRPAGAFNTAPGAVVTLSGASACDVFWTPTQAATLGANTVFAGSVISDSGITVGANTTWNGRSLAFGGTITTATDTITVPSCSVPIIPPTGASANSVAPLIDVTKVPNPLVLHGPGSVTYTYKVTNPGPVTLTDVTLTDDKCSNVTFVGGDLNNNGWLESNETWTYTCTTTLNTTTVNFATATGFGNGLSSVDTAIAEVVVGPAIVPPLIHVTKVPSPLGLPQGGGNVTYTYKVTNPGTVALNNVTLTDDKCTSPKLISGDNNGDSLLQPTETWTYTCTTDLVQTTTNTAVASGQANGLTAVDTALATVVLAGSPVPPLIHIVKAADPVILPAGGGMVTYTYMVTNPGTVPLSNVMVTDNKCGPLVSIIGDANGNGLLDTQETWTYTCRENLALSTTNTATATGQGNGLTVTDLAVASVAVSPTIVAPTPTPPPPVVVPPPPKLPNTGVDPNSALTALIVAAAALFVTGTLAFAVTRRKQVR